MCAAISSTAPGRRARRPRSDLVLYILFFFPGMLAFVYAGYGFAKLSWLMNEHSAASPNGPLVYHFKIADPDRRRPDGDAGHRRGHPLHHVHPDRRMAASACMTSRSSTRSCSRRPSTASTPMVKEPRRSGSARVPSDVRPGQSRARRADARPVRRLHHVRLPDRLHADGARRVLRLFRDGRPRLLAAGPAHLFGDDERRADLDPAVRLHGLHHRARQHPRPAVPVAAARGRPDARRRSRSRRSPPARSSRPPPASSARW